MEIDDILEEDLLDIFNSFDGPKGTKVTLSKNESVDELSDLLNEPIKETKSQSILDESVISKPLSIDSSNIDSIASLLKELLNNKTIEITIKIK